MRICWFTRYRPKVSEICVLLDDIIVSYINAWINFKVSYKYLYKKRAPLAINRALLAIDLVLHRCLREMLCRYSRSCCQTEVTKQIPLHVLFIFQQCHLYSALEKRCRGMNLQSQQKLAQLLKCCRRFVINYCNKWNVVYVGLAMGTPDAKQQEPIREAPYGDIALRHWPISLIDNRQS